MVIVPFNPRGQHGAMDQCKLVMDLAASLSPLRPGSLSPLPASWPTPPKHQCDGSLLPCPFGGLWNHV